MPNHFIIQKYVISVATRERIGACTAVDCNLIAAIIYRIDKLRTGDQIRVGRVCDLVVLDKAVPLNSAKAVPSKVLT